jgi:hypothetical protein
MTEIGINLCGAVALVCGLNAHLEQVHLALILINLEGLVPAVGSKFTQAPAAKSAKMR